MKDYTDEELMKLSVDQRKELVDFECAIEGIPLPDDPETVNPPQKPHHEKDVYGFILSHAGGGNLAFPSREAAEQARQAVMNLGPLSELYMSGPSYERKLVPVSEITIEQKQYYSPQRWLKIGHELEAYEKDKKAWEAKENALEKLIEGRAAIQKEMDDRVREASRQRTLCHNMGVRFRKYMTLSGDDPGIALRFLVDAWKDEEEFIVDHMKKILKMAGYEAEGEIYDRAIGTYCSDVTIERIRNA